MSKKVFRRPDEAALRRVLEAHRGAAAELILRLAWQAGLDRNEMRALEWSHLAGGYIRLPHRAVPLEPELWECLENRRALDFSASSPYVLLTDLRHTHPHPVQISGLAAAALDTEEATRHLTLKDLRDDFIIRCLESHGKAHAVRVGGISMRTLYSTYGQFLPQAQASAPQSTVDGAALRRFLSAEGTSPAAVAVWLVWKCGLTLPEIADLTWESVDFSLPALRLGGRTVALEDDLAALLARIKASRGPGDDPHLLLTPRARRPFHPDRLDVVVRTALIRHGLEGVHLGSLSHAEANRESGQRLLRRAEELGCTTRNEAMALLGLTAREAYALLRALTAAGRLVRVGVRYYPAGTVVPPAEHYPLIRERLEAEGAAYRKDLAALLGLDARACGWVLQKLVAEGKLIRRGQAYLLPEEGEEE